MLERVICYNSIIKKLPNKILTYDPVFLENIGKYVRFDSYCLEMHISQEYGIIPFILLQHFVLDFSFFINI